MSITYLLDQRNILRSAGHGRINVHHLIVHGALLDAVGLTTYNHLIDLRDVELRISSDDIPRLLISFIPLDIDASSIRIAWLISESRLLSLVSSSLRYSLLCTLPILVTHDCDKAEMFVCAKEQAREVVR